MKDATVIFGGAAGSSPTSRGFFTREAAPEGYRRLALMAGVLSGAVLVMLIVWLIEGIATGEWGTPVGVGGSVLFLILMLVVLVGCRRRMFPVRAFVPIALSVEVSCSIFASACSIFVRRPRSRSRRRPMNARFTSEEAVSISSGKSSGSRWMSPVMAFLTFPNSWSR